MDKDIIHLHVYLCSDGTLMAYNQDSTLNLIYSDLTGWSTLKEIYRVSNLSSSARKGMNKDINVKYIKYYFKSTVDNSYVEIPPSHIKNILSNLIG